MDSHAKVSAIIPARNEEATIACAVASLAEQREVGEIIVVNDQSTDHTAEILQELAPQTPKLLVVCVESVPSGWVGKNYAAWTGASRASGEWLLFTDADVEHLPASAARALADAAVSGAALGSYSPEQEMHTWWERALIPFIFCRLARRFSYAAVNDPASPAAAANGQYLLIRRDAYQAIGGHESVAGEVLEDVALAHRLKQRGYWLHFASGADIARTRMYRSFGSLWQGWVKNLYPLMGGSIRAVGGEVAAIMPWVTLVLLAGAVVFRSRLLLSGALAALILRHTRYARELFVNRFSRWLTLYNVPGTVFYCLTLLTSAGRYARGTVTWKGRSYAVGFSKRGA